MQRQDAAADCHRDGGVTFFEVNFKKNADSDG